METTTIEEQLKEINEKLAVITEEMEATKRHRIEMQELGQDLTVVAKDMFDTAVVELDEIAPFVRTEQIFHLMKKILRNIGPLADAFAKFESLLDLGEEISPIGRDIFKEILFKLDEFDRKGYFEFYGEVTKILDVLISNTTPEDFDRVRENVVLPFIELLKNLADTELLPSLNRAFKELKETEPGKLDMSLWKVFRQLSSKEIRPVLGMLVVFLQAFAKESFDKASERR